MNQFIKDNGKVIFDRDMENNIGKMAQYMKVIGIIINLMVRVNFSIQMVISTKVNGKIIKHMDMGSTPMRMEIYTSVNGQITYKMVPVKKLGKMVQNL